MVLDDLLRVGLKLVVCGTAAGERSARLGQHYAGSANRFWRALARLGLTPRRLTPGEAGLPPNLGIGLTGLAADQSGPDSGIDFGDENRAFLRRNLAISIVIPLDPVFAPEFRRAASWTLPQLLGYLRTWSATARYIEANCRDPVEELGERLSAPWGSAADRKTVTWPLTLRVGRA